MGDRCETHGVENCRAKGCAVNTAEKRRYYRLTPSEKYGFDSLTVPAGPENNWKSALEILESTLDGEYCKMEDEGGTWSDIKVTIECVELTDEEFGALLEG